MLPPSTVTTDPVVLAVVLAVARTNRVLWMVR